jgi:hypothetical protein
MLRCLRLTVFQIAVPEFVAVGGFSKAFLSGSVKGGGWDSVLPSIFSLIVVLSLPS